jgi:SAM-dependent methyltransferase
MKRTICMNCGESQLEEFIDLGRQPNGNNFPLPGEENSEPTFEISMLVCKNCWQVQIAEFPPQEFLFPNHPYITGVNVPVVQHFERMSAHIVKKLNLGTGDLVVDIGCNDGTLLSCFRAQGMRVLGVDPGQQTGRLAKENKIPVCETFWNSETGRAFRHLKLLPDVITATAVFYHLPDLHDFIEGLKLVMKPNSVFVGQCVNLMDLIEKNQFDHFYHEHSCIHSIAPLKRLFDAHGMVLFDVEFTEIHGGSFIVYAALKESNRPVSPNVDEAIKKEIANGFHKLETYKAFALRVKENTTQLRHLLTQLRDQGKTVVALGAPVKGNTLLTYAGIDKTLIKCVTEVNKFKIGRLTPGTHIPIIHESELKTPPDYFLILSWNFLDFFITKHKTYLMNGGKFIVPVPSVHVLGFDSVK